MTKLNLTELDRLEQILHAKKIAVAPIFPGEVEAILGQLRPLLDLVHRMGTALADFVEAVPPNEDFIAEDGVKVYELQADELDIKYAQKTLDDYQRAKENK